MIEFVITSLRSLLARCARAALAATLVVVSLTVVASDPPCEDVFRKLGGGAGANEAGRSSSDRSAGERMDATSVGTHRRAVYGPHCADGDCTGPAVGPATGTGTGVGGDLVVHLAYDCDASRDAATVLDSFVRGTTATRRQIRYRFLSLDDANVDLAVASVAAAMHESWATFHASLMAPIGDDVRSIDDLIERAAKAAGVEMEALRREMELAKRRGTLDHHAAEIRQGVGGVVPTYLVDGHRVHIAEFLIELDSPRAVMLKLESLRDESALARGLHELYELVLGGLP